jgi:hypothetical protein
MTERPVYMDEPRGDLETRFRITGQFVLRARELSMGCGLLGCGCCAHLAPPIDLPSTVAAPGREPREDLEDACESIAERLALVATHEDADVCPAGQWVHGLLEAGSK